MNLICGQIFLVTLIPFQISSLLTRLFWVDCWNIVVTFVPNHVSIEAISGIFLSIVVDTRIILNAQLDCV